MRLLCVTGYHRRSLRDTTCSRRWRRRAAPAVPLGAIALLFVAGDDRVVETHSCVSCSAPVVIEDCGEL